MSSSDPTPLIRILRGEQVFGRDTDSKILQAANEMSARLMFELFLRSDISTAEGAAAFANELRQYRMGDPSALLGFDDGRSFGKESTDESAGFPADERSVASKHFLRLEFSTPEACYYQFHLFPAMTEAFILSAARKREAQFQHLQIELIGSQYLQIFIEGLRRNPHLRQIHDSSEREFNDAPSHSV